MLPTTSKGLGRTSSHVRPNSVLPQYLRKIIKWQQMDIEYTFWQMLHLCTSPKVVYQHTKYHKQTKNQWARDDPAFIVICTLLLVIATLAYCAAIAFSFYTHRSYFGNMLLVPNQQLPSRGSSKQSCRGTAGRMASSEPFHNNILYSVYFFLLMLNFETGYLGLYAFDVHCNSFFPMFVLLYVIHYFLSPLLVAHGFIPVLLSNLLFMVAASYYHYLNFLGYDVLPFLERTTFFLYPIGIVIVLSPIFILIGFNPSRHFMNIYFSRVL
ncbi:hypothetical protein H5410_010427 [Solanum commersonii]|uniref:UNC-50 family protein n=1 Tax=Solanum commersonii TaxID=4109 RepID=A0A9J6ALC7_SOLCO|nr:hypothetical protein H5410_010427 [Solanum commersonii]